MAVYLIHLDQPFGHAKHYVGYAENIEGRLRNHEAGTGANMLRHVRNAGIGWRCVRVWPDGDKNYERRLKQHSGTRYCPECRGPAAWTRGAWIPSIPYLQSVPEVLDAAPPSSEHEHPVGSCAARASG